MLVKRSMHPWPYGHIDKMVAGPEDADEVDDDT